MMIGSSWVVSLIFSLVLKFSLSTTYSKWYCTDGFNEEIEMTIIYYVLRTLLGTVLPSFIIFFLYKKILFKVKMSMDMARLPNPALQNPNNVEDVLKIFSIYPPDDADCIDIETLRTPAYPANRIRMFLNRLTQRITETHQANINRNNSTNHRAKRHFNFARQIFLINMIVILASLFSVLVSLNLVLISYSEDFFLYTPLRDARYVLRIIFLLIQCGIPIVSWMLYPGTFHYVLSENRFLAKIEDVFLFFLLLIRKPE
jgi:hypothetical protein